MIKPIPISSLKPGVYIHDLKCSWLEHNFLRNSFLVGDEETVRRVRETGVQEILIDIKRGIDPEAVVAVEPPAVEAAPARPEAPQPEAAPAPVVATARKSGSEFERARALKGEANLIVRDMMTDIRLGKQIELEKIEPLVERIVDSIFCEPDALAPLARLKEHDAYTFQHSVSVCALMVAFARTLGLDRPTIREIAIGALLHDVGKAKVPDEILNKPAKLTDAEFDKMKSHVVQSKIILQASPGISQIALDVAAQHHERFDGSGYPNKLRGDEISLYGQMGSIVDVYDAITSNRVYHKGMAPTEALRKLLTWTDGHFKPDMVKAFIRSVGIYPTGALVRLESRRLAVVQSQNDDKPMQPVVKVIFHTAGHYLKPQNIDLRRSQDRIVGHEDFESWQIDPVRWLPQ
ncbi:MULTISPECIES: HD-GYP domain-containing protein [unclassified Thauera]|uniref:HD-GYP domain-containing protein n=1 Tax=unclassified Thauera TaxID=2609274 RepID=UPI000569DA18|nr:MULTISPECIES: HD-GYP domain-containing protein [unclassified Thauera]WBL63968.1 HD-GYP domain-containing protein [Thauera sp. WB-2]HNR61931.1 HD-GYP domain-containing protein [Thauera sp.]HNS92902.1 HD-GYP domain-containing protein [Thauera sp.]HRK11450.1 HD-GYP domain-containing protein [Thauera sp.]